MSDDTLVVPFEEDPPYVAGPRPPEFERAPAWARILFDQQRRDRHAANNNFMKLDAQILALTQVQAETSKKLGEEPDADGHGGKGLIGDIRKTGRDVASLMDLRSKGLGFIIAVSLFGALILAGLVALVERIASGVK